MASKVYPNGIKNIMNGTIDLDTHTIKAMLVNTGSYTYSDTHEFLSSVAAGARCTGGIGTLGSVTITVSSNLVTFDGGDITLTSVAGGQGSFDTVLFYKDTGVEGTSCLISKNDLASAITPNGGNINLAFDANGIIRVTT